MDSVAQHGSLGWRGPRLGADDDLHPLALVAIVFAGALSAVPLHFVGTIYAGEIILAPIAFLGIMSGYALPAGRRLDAALIGLLIAAFLATDLITANTQDNMLRGVARSGFLLSSFLALNTLCRNSPSRLALFLFTYAACDFVRGILQPQFGTIEDVWKFQVGIPCTIIVLSFLDRFAQTRVTVVRTILAALTSVHLLLNYRSAALICLVMLLVCYIRSPDASRRKTAIHRALAIVAIVLLLALFWNFYKSATDRFAQRNSGSNAARVAGLVVAAEMISESPFIGYGSWVYGADVVSRVSQRFTSMTGTEYYASRQSIYAAAHSQVLQAWYEAGLLAVPFFILYFARHFRCISLWMRTPNPSAFRHALVLLLLLDIWHFFLSPFAGPQRVTMAAGLAAALSYISLSKPVLVVVTSSHRILGFRTAAR